MGFTTIVLGLESFKPPKGKMRRHCIRMVDDKPKVKVKYESESRMENVFACIKGGMRTTTEVRDALNYPITSTRTYLHKLVKAGRLRMNETSTRFKTTVQLYSVAK